MYRIDMSIAAQQDFISMSIILFASIFRPYYCFTKLFFFFILHSVWHEIRDAYTTDKSIAITSICLQYVFQQKKRQSFSDVFEPMEYFTPALYTITMHPNQLYESMILYRFETKLGNCESIELIDHPVCCGGTQQQKLNKQFKQNRFFLLSCFVTMFFKKQIALKISIEHVLHQIQHRIPKQAKFVFIFYYVQCLYQSRIDHQFHCD